jgi:hypothetical protein
MPATNCIAATASAQIAQGIDKLLVQATTLAAQQGVGAGAMRS